MTAYEWHQLLVKEGGGKDFETRGYFLSTSLKFAKWQLLQKMNNFKNVLVAKLVFESQGAMFCTCDVFIFFL